MKTPLFLLLMLGAGSCLGQKVAFLSKTDSTATIIVAGYHIRLTGLPPGHFYTFSIDTVPWTPSIGWFRDADGRWFQVKDIESVHKNAGKISAKGGRP